MQIFLPHKMQILNCRNDHFMHQAQHSVKVRGLIMQNSIAVIMVPKWRLFGPPVKSYISPIHRNGPGQTDKFRSPNIIGRPQKVLLYILPLSTTYLKTKRADRFAEECYFIEVRPLTIILQHIKSKNDDSQRIGINLTQICLTFLSAEKAHFDGIAQ